MVKVVRRLLIWVVATAAATGLAWAGVQSVVTGVAAPLPAAPVATVDGEPAAGPTDQSTTTRAAARTRTFEVRGGTATVRFAPDEVEVLGAVPAAGYAVDVEAEGIGTRVEFESAGHRTRLRVWWQDGPRHAVEEDVRDGDDPVDPGDDGRDDHAEEPVHDGDDDAGHGGDD